VIAFAQAPASFLSGALGAIEGCAGSGSSSAIETVDLAAFAA
jgi:hypothetical protein